MGHDRFFFLFFCVENNNCGACVVVCVFVCVVVRTLLSVMVCGGVWCGVLVCVGAW
jgi:hypothetical protein